MGDYHISKGQLITYICIVCLLVTANVIYQISHMGIFLELYFLKKLIILKDISQYKIYLYILGIILYLMCIIFLVIQPIKLNLKEAKTKCEVMKLYLLVEMSVNEFKLKGKNCKKY